MLPADKQRLVREHLSYVRSLAGQIKEKLSPSIELDDLVGYGTQGLLEASERFDPKGGATFATFSYYRIRGAIFDGLRQMGWLSRAEYARYRVEERANTYLESLADRQASSGNGEESLESRLQAVSDTMAGVAAIFVTSLEGLPSAGQQTVDDKPGADAYLLDAELSGRVKQAIQGLPDKERRLLELYYFDGKKLEEAGAALGLSKSWASRLHARAIGLLRAALEEPDSPAPRARGGATRRQPRV